MKLSTNEEELKLLSQGYKVVVGVDEVGYGCFAGDVYVAAVILPGDIDYLNLLPGLYDSKAKTPTQREVLFEQIKQHALDYCIASASVEEIEELNVYYARFLAARRALEGLKMPYDYVIMDGNKTIPGISTPQRAIVKGDQKSISIASASILAKVARDAYMVDLAKQVHSDFDWVSNKGYHCAKHVEALKKHGATKWHRKQFIKNFI